MALLNLSRPIPGVAGERDGKVRLLIPQTPSHATTRANKTIITHDGRFSFLPLTLWHSQKPFFLLSRAPKLVRKPFFLLYGMAFVTFPCCWGIFRGATYFTVLINFP